MRFQNASEEQQRAYTVRQRNKARLWGHLSNGFRELIRHPWKLAPLFALAALCLLAWSNRGRVALTSPIPLFSTLWAYAIDALIVLLSVIALLATLVALGTPYQSKQIEESLALGRVVDRHGFPPILLSRRCDKNDKITIITLTFYSHGISKELWEERKQKIEEVLNMHWTEDVKYGGRLNNNGKYIILTVANGTEIVERGETLYED